MAGIRKTLRIAEFRALLISYVINRAGDVFGALALAVVVLGTTRSAIAIAALFLATQFLPGLVGPFLVARVGAIPSGRLLPLCYLLEACLFLVLAAVSRHMGVALIVALAFVDGMLAFAARSVTRATAASTLIPHDLMPEGKAAFNLALAAATVAGPVLGGAVLALVGPGAALAADGLSFLIAAILLACTPGLRARNGLDPSSGTPSPSSTRRLQLCRWQRNAPCTDIRRRDRVHLLLPRRSSDRHLRVAFAPRWSGGVRGDPRELGRRCRDRLDRARPFRAPRRPRDHSDLNRFRRGRILGHGARAVVAPCLRLERARRSGQRHAMGLSRDRRAPTSRGAFPPSSRGGAGVDGRPGAGGGDSPWWRTHVALLTARRVSRRWTRARRADQRGGAQPCPCHGAPGRRCGRSRDRLRAGARLRSRCPVETAVARRSSGAASACVARRDGAPGSRRRLVVDSGAAHAAKLRLHGHVHRLIGAERVLMLGAPSLRIPSGPIDRTACTHHGRLVFSSISKNSGTCQQTAASSPPGSRLGAAPLRETHSQLDRDGRRDCERVLAALASIEPKLCKFGVGLSLHLGT